MVSGNLNSGIFLVIGLASKSSAFLFLSSIVKISFTKFRLSCFFVMSLSFCAFHLSSLKQTTSQLHIFVFWVFDVLSPTSTGAVLLPTRTTLLLPCWHSEHWWRDLHCRGFASHCRSSRCSCLARCVKQCQCRRRCQCSGRSFYHRRLCMQWRKI